MKLKTVYLILSVLALVVPYWKFVPWVIDNGPNLRLLIEQLFANRIAAFFGLDVIVCVVVIWVFVRAEGTRLGVRMLWLPVLATLTVGAALGLALFLYLRELRVEEAGRVPASR
jgi:hypothetical protein